MMRFKFTFVFLLISFIGTAQDTLSIDTVLAWVNDHHPVVRSLAYRMNRAEANEMAARGAFDPSVMFDFAEKQFDEQNYYSYGEAGVKLPTWLGIDVYAARAFADGVYLNPRQNLPAEGLWRMGVDVPIGGDLIWDERRAMLRDAQLVIQRTEAEQRLAYSDVIYETKLRYLEWAQKEAELSIYREVAQLAEERFLLVRRAFQSGERRAMDTVESRIQWYNRLLLVQEAKTAANQSRAKLSAMLWVDDNVPLEIPDSFHPDLNELDFIIPPDSTEIFNQLATQPTVASLTVEVDRALNQRRYSRMQLWPDVSVQYNILRGVGEGEQWNIPSQYQWGVELNIPLFLRNARGKAEVADMYYREAEMKRIDAVQKAEAEMRSLQTATYNLAQQWAQSEEVYVMSESLLQAERRRFILGESSVFLVNSRENAMVQAAQKWIKIRTEYLLTIERQRRLVADYWPD
ncbi:MAG: TolC family protein [Flavobacteriia bacterium]|nr:TolC family protein [Flavobacteriia bacterium]